MRDVFISHAAEDANISIEIAYGLEREGYTTWYYERDGKVPGIPHLTQTSEAIKEAKTVILVISPHSIESNEVNTEVLYSHAINKKIVPLRIDIAHDDIKKRQPDWHFILSTTVSIIISSGDVHSVLPQIRKGLEELGIRPDKKDRHRPPSRRYFKNITPPEPNFVGRTKLLETITEWYKNPHIRIGTLIGLGGAGKSSIARKWYDMVEENNINPVGIFWWGFYRNAYLDIFLDSLLDFLANGRIISNEIKSTWAKVDKINKLISEGEYLIILDGFEEMQEGTDCSEEEFGCMKHQEISELLKFWAETNVSGLCLITSRYPLTEMRNWEGTKYQKKDVERLSVEDGRLLFEKIGVKGAQKDIDLIINKYEGHVLSLTLIAKSLVDYYNGDVKKANQIPPIYGGIEAGGKARRILEWYAEQLSDEHLAFMKIVSLFQAEVNERDFKGVFRSKMDTEINKPLISMNPHLFNVMVKNLCDKYLISVIPKGQDNTYTTHPLIKGYFKSIMREDDNKACHKKIYEYIGTYVPTSPETLEEMIPLFEQVHHGCNAGLYDEAFNVYWNMIQRKDKFYLIYRLGAWETNLSIVLNFFTEGDLLGMPKVSKSADQGYLLNAAGLSLFAIGRPPEAEELFKKALKMNIEDKDWQYASIAYEDLTALQFRLGKLKEARETVENSLEISNQAEDNRYIAILKAWFGYILFCQGETERSKELFEEANEIYQELWPDVGGLYGIFWEGYAKFLITMERRVDAYNLNIRNLKLFTDNNLPAHISRCNRSLGTLERINKNYNKSEKYLCDSLKIVRAIGIQFLEIDTLIELGRLRLETEDYRSAESDLKEALKLIDRTGFKLYEPDAEVVLANVFVAQDDIEKAKKFAKSAYEKARQMNYYWPQKDVEDLLNSIR